jgi:hypothetical protein
VRRSLPGSILVRTGLRLLRGYTGPAARAFAAACSDAEGTQARVLAELVRGAADTGYGRHHQIRGDEDHAGFAAKLPVVGWDELQPWLAEERGAPGALAPAPVTAWVRSAGKTGPAKRVPYTARLRKAFQHMFYVWTHDLLGSGLKLSKGFCYLNVVAPDLVRDGRGDIEDEAEYLDGSLGPIARRFFVVDPRIRRLHDADAFRTVLTLSLLSAVDLEVVSVWDPRELLDYLDLALARRDELADALDGRAVEREGMTFRFDPLGPERRAALAAGDLAGVWPSLKLISCWTTAGAAAGAAELAAHFPAARLQGKGLICVEAPITVPLEAAGGYLPLVDQVFLELEGPDGSLRLLHQAEDGGEYAVIVSQPAGLLRYRIGDRVRVTGRWQGTPCLEYLGRER